MSKGQRGNKEAKKPKQAPVAAKPQAPPVEVAPATRANPAPRPGKR